VPKLTAALAVHPKQQQLAASLDGAPRKGLLSSGSAMVCTETDMTWQLRQLFCKEIKRKRRKTLGLARVIESPIEACLG
jgi:hypothetical protein